MTECQPEERRDSKGNLRVITENLNRRSAMNLKQNDGIPNEMEENISSAEERGESDSSSTSIVSPRARKAMRSSIQPLPTPALDHIPSFPSSYESPYRSTSVSFSPLTTLSAQQDSLGSLIVPKRNQRPPTDTTSTSRIATEYRLVRPGATPNDDASAGITPRNVSLEIPRSTNETQAKLRREVGPTIKIELDSTDYKLLESGPFEEMTLDDHPARVYSSTLQDSQEAKWLILKKAGTGAFSTVYVGQNLREPTASIPGKVAIKYVHCSKTAGDRVQISVEREVECLKAVHHPCLTSLLACDIKPTMAILVMPYCSGGDLFDFLSSHPQKMTVSLSKRFFAEISSAVYHLHSRHFVHRDLKLESKHYRFNAN